MCGFGHGEAVVGDLHEAGVAVGVFEVDADGGSAAESEEEGVLGVGEVEVEVGAGEVEEGFAERSQGQGEVSGSEGQVVG
jgi:hypothetical protein